MADKLTVNIDDLTLGELEDFEEAAGISVADIQARGGSMPVRAVSALVWVTKRRDDKDFTLDQARKIKLSEVEFTNPTEGDS